MLGANASVTRINYLDLAGNKTPERFHVFVVDVLRILRTKNTLFMFHPNTLKGYILGFHLLFININLR